MLSAAKLIHVSRFAQNYCAKPMENFIALVKYPIYYYFNR